MDFSKYFVEEQDRYLCKYPITEVKIHKEFFNKKLAQVILKDVECLGIFYIYFYKSLDIEKEKPERILLKLPMTIRMCPSDIIETSIDGEPHFILRFNQYDVFMKTRSLVKHVVNVEKGFNLLFNNFMPPSIAYSDEFTLIKDCKNINGIGLKSTDQSLALIIAEANRDPNDISKPFRKLLKEKPDTSEYSRKLVRVTDLARIKDSFMGIASAHPDRSIRVAIAQHRNPKTKREESPVLDTITTS